MQELSYMVRVLSARVHKGDIRNTVLRQVKTLHRSISQLQQGMAIKEQEVSQFARKKPDKAHHLEQQVDIIRHGITNLQRALKILERYKETVSQ